jgi:hypothetical protein
MDKIYLLLIRQETNWMISQAAWVKIIMKVIFKARNRLLEPLLKVSTHFLEASSIINFKIQIASCPNIKRWSWQKRGKLKISLHFHSNINSISKQYWVTKIHNLEMKMVHPCFLQNNKECLNILPNKSRKRDLHLYSKSISYLIVALQNINSNKE